MFSLRKTVHRAAVSLIFSVFLIHASNAQNAVSGRVLEAESNQPIPGANVVIQGTQRGAATDGDGRYTIPSLSPGTYTLIVRFIGFHAQQKEITVRAGSTVTADFRLEPNPIDLGGIQVTALRPDLLPQSELKRAAVREANPRDSGELLRAVPGVEAVRRGPVGLDPVVRGLRETEVGTYLDGTRIFPGGPARMDSPLSHLDPSSIESIEVVKGPYALTWGAGNLSAIRVETQPMNAIPDGAAHGRLSGGYDGNFGASEGAASFFGRQGKVSYRLHGAWRQGNDYESGNGTTVPADFLSREIRGKVGIETGSASRLTVSGGYQNQDGLDYPGRLLNADFFDVYNVSGKWELDRKMGMLHHFEIQAYGNDVDHGMTNAGKPTAEPMEGRMPPFALDVRVKAAVQVRGGRTSANFTMPSGMDVQIGADLYRANRDAVRTIERQENGMLLFEDMMWPDATILDAGLFAKLSKSVSEGLLASGTLRLDHVDADAGPASDFFVANVSNDLEASENNVSAALTLGLTPNDHWSVSLGAGSAVRTADATERYSDRVPASKAQTSAEFVGNPALAPERNTQLDLWLEGAFPRWSLSVNGFGRMVADFITLEPTDLPKRLPLSPNTVYRYVNGDATFYGGEASVSVLLMPELQATVGGRYLYGQDDLLDEPALGVAPASMDIGLRWEEEGGRWFAQAIARTNAKQDRVASARGEIPTDGYTTIDLRGGIRVTPAASIQLGVTNLTDAEYTNHLNAKNPFTGIPIPEPGRILSADVVFSF